MLVTLHNLVKKYNLRIKGVIHIGAHYGQEYPDYVREKVANMVFFEPAALSYEKLIKVLPEADNVLAFKYALGNRVGTAKMYTEKANQGMSSSLLEPKDHLVYSPTITFDTVEKVKITKLDNVPLDHTLYNMINIDVQGYELEVFKGAVETLKHIDIIYSEINCEELYKDCVQLNELDAFLKKHNFIRIFTHMAHKSWGDALYLKYE